MNWILTSNVLPERQTKVFVWVNGSAEIAWVAVWSNGDKEWVFQNEDLENGVDVVTHWCAIVPPKVNNA